MKPFLSIVIPIIDRDCFTISKTIADIHNKVKVSHEVIIVDNREKNKDLKIDFGDAKVISKGRNLYQFESKRWSSEFCNGEYIWFIDSDDSIFEVDFDTDFIAQHDLVVFDYILNSAPEPLREWNRNYRYHGEFDGEYKLINKKQYSIETIRSFIQCYTWNKWFKTSIFKEITNNLPCDKNIIIMEDEFWVFRFLKKIDNFLIFDKILYCHNENTGLTTKKSFNINKFKIFFTGFSDIKELMTKHFNKETKDMILMCSLEYLLFKIGNLEKKSEALEIFKILSEYYSEQQITIALDIICFEWGLNQSVFLLYTLYKSSEQCV